MTNILLVIEIILGIVMTLLILIQHRASGLSATFGGTGGTAGAAYLHTTLNKRAFPELWSLRTRL